MKTNWRQYINSEIEFLQALNNPRQRRLLLKNPSKELIAFIRNICFNLLDNKIPVSAKDRKKLRKFKETIRILADEKKKKKTVKKAILLSGGFVSVLTPVLISLLSQLGGRLFSKAIGV
jgi:hypothetical protein